MVLSFFLHVMVFLGVAFMSLGDFGSPGELVAPKHVEARLVKSADVLPPPPEPVAPEKQPDIARPQTVAKPQPVMQKSEPVISDTPENRVQVRESLQDVQETIELAPQPDLSEVRQRIKQVLEQDATPVDGQTVTPTSEKIDELLRSLSTERSEVTLSSRNTPLQSDNARDMALIYLARNKKLVEQNFNVGGALQKQLFADLNVQLRIRLAQDGTLTDVAIIKSSGNDLFDQKAINAVRRVGKFIVPVDDQLAEQYFREIIMDYTL